MTDAQENSTRNWYENNGTSVWSVCRSGMELLWYKISTQNRTFYCGTTNCTSFRSVCHQHKNSHASFRQFTTV